MDILSWPLGWVMYLVYSLVDNYGLAIILFTVIIKVIIFPLSIKQQKSSVVMSIMQPKVKEIQKKYKNDRIKAQDAMMQLYKDNGVSQLAGCLPMLVQMPILFGLINVIYNPLTHILRIPRDTINEAAKLFVNEKGEQVVKVVESAIKAGVDATPSKFTMFTPEQIESIQNLNISFLGFNLTDVPQLAFNILLLVPIISVSTMVCSQFITMKISGTLDNEATKKTVMPMIIMTSFMSFIFAFAVPIGVSVYWIASSVIQILQAFILNKLYNKDAIKQKMEAEMKSREIEARQKRKEEKKKVITAKSDDNSNDDNKENNGKKQKVVSEKEYYKIRLEKARELDRQKYGDESEVSLENALLERSQLEKEKSNNSTNNVNEKQEVKDNDSYQKVSNEVLENNDNVNTDENKNVSDDTEK